MEATCKGNSRCGGRSQARPLSTYILLLCAFSIDIAFPFLLICCKLFMPYIVPPKGKYLLQVGLTQVLQFGFNYLDDLVVNNPVASGRQMQTCIASKLME